MSSHKSEIIPPSRLSSSCSEYFNLSSSEDAIKLRAGLSRASGRGQARPASLNQLRQDALVPTRTASSDVVRELESSSKRMNKRPSSLVARLSPTKMLHIGKKRKAEERYVEDEPKASPYPFKVDNTRDRGSTQSVPLSGFFPSYSPVLYFGDVGSFDVSLCISSAGYLAR